MSAPSVFGVPESLRDQMKNEFKKLGDEFDDGDSKSEGTVKDYLRMASEKMRTDMIASLMHKMTLAELRSAVPEELRPSCLKRLFEGPKDFD